MGGTAGAGLFTDASLRAALEAGQITCEAGLGAAQVQPASLDLTLGPVAYRLRASFLPGAARSVEERMNDGLLMHAIDLTHGAVL
ncbi:MAG: 2'-deoxycytidine 5'-triphosphate deaminase, partial [Pseudomonadota bacterium]